MTAAFKATRLAIPDLVLIEPRRFRDERGMMAETFRVEAFRDIGVDAHFVQDNEALSHRRGTVRGLHFQAPPCAQAKLVRVLAGAIFDVAVDIRRGSPTYGRSVAVELSAERGDQLYIPHGFAHGYCTLTDDALVTYKCDAYYAPATEGGLHVLDESLAIDWPVAPDASLLSPKDRVLPGLAAFASPFSL
jgi:dTDP-4-dehydrorhamnose 3,5-epimerase